MIADTAAGVKEKERATEKQCIKGGEREGGKKEKKRENYNQPHCKVYCCCTTPF